MEELVKVNNGEIKVAEEVVNKIKEFYKQKKEMEYQEKLLKEGLMNAMQLVGKENFIVDGLSATIRKGTTRTSIDSARLKNECPEIYESYLKTSEVKPSIILTIAD